MGAADKPRQASGQWALPLASLLLILLAAAGLRLVDLGDPSLWDDEMHTVDFAQRPVATMYVQSAQKDSNPLGFYLLLHAWLTRGDGEAFFRLPSALFGLLVVIAFYWLGTTLYTRRAGLFAAGLAALHPLAVYCSREVRAHAAALLAIVLATTFLVRLLSRGKWRDAVGLALCGAAALHLHYYAFLVLGGQGLMLVYLAVRDLRRARRAMEPALQLTGVAALQRHAPTGAFGHTLAAGALAAHRARLRGVLLGLAGLLTSLVLFLPFFKVFAFQLLRGQDWRPAMSLPAELARAAIYFAYGATPDRLPTFFLDWHGTHALFWAATAWVLAALPLTAAIAVGWRDRDEREARTIALGLLAAPWALTLAVAAVVPLFDVRHALLLMPPALVLAARGLDRLAGRSGVAAAGLALLIALPMTLALWQERTDPAYARQDWRGAAAQVCRDRRPADLAIAYHPEKSYAFRYYARACGLRVEDLFDDAVFRLDLAKRQTVTATRLADLERYAGRVWLVDYHGAVFDPLDQARTQLQRDGFYLVRRGVYDRGVKRFAIDLFTRDRAEAEAAYGPAVDFAQPYNPGQLRAGWYPPGENGAWIGATAELLLKRDGQPTANATVYVHRPFYRTAVTLRLFVGDMLVGEQRIDQTAQVTLSGAIPPTTAASGLLPIRLEASPTFIPAEVLTTADRTPKGVLVQRVFLR